MGFGDDDPALGLFLFFNPFDNYAILKWSDLHASSLLSLLNENGRIQPILNEK
jgi:hypothetical protein